MFNSFAYFNLSIPLYWVFLGAIGVGGQLGCKYKYWMNRNFCSVFSFPLNSCMIEHVWQQSLSKKFQKGMFLVNLILGMKLSSIWCKILLCGSHVVLLWIHFSVNPRGKDLVPQKLWIQLQVFPCNIIGERGKWVNLSFMIY